MNRTKPIAFLLASLALAPALATGRPACCLKTGVATIATKSCCSAMAPVGTSIPKGCCKTPVAPTPETRADAGAPAAVVIPPLELSSQASVPVMLSAAVSVRLARRAHRAESPDDSPPDLLARIHILLI